MTKRILAAFLATVILLTLAGCASKAELSVTDTTGQTETIMATTAGAAETDTATEHTEETENGTTGETPPAVTTEPQAPSESVTEPTETDIAETKPSVTEPTPAETDSVETKPSQTEPTEPPKTTEPDIPPNQTVELPKDTEPKQETQPTEVTKPEPVPFDIDYWIAYAKSYAESKELVLDHTAVDCWDNPIRVGAHCLYLERDIQSRLNRYEKDADITDVWIWAEPAGNDCYDIYIGYA